ncbi:HamA C-terminal domain-containing protein [Cupriavidus basilensis]
MDFEILVDDLYLKIFADTALAPINNKRVLSLVNDFEDARWRFEKFENFIWDNVALTALSAWEREKLTGQSRSMLRESAKNLRLTDKAGDIGQGSELAEIVLYGIMHHHYKALPVVPKIFYKQNVQDNAKGADSVHIVLEGDNDFSLWFGEAKFYNSIEDARLPAVVDSVGNSLKTDKLKKESSIITNTSDIDRLVRNPELAANIKDALSPRASIDNIKPKIHVPILLLHECAITAAAKEMNDAYRQGVRQHHLERATAYLKKQFSSLSNSVSKYSEIRFHLILFPVPDRVRLIDQFSKEVAFHKA